MAHTMAQLERDIANLLAELEKPGPFLSELGQRLKQSFAYGFNQQKSPDNEPWKPSRRAERDGQIKSGQTLIDTGRLRRSIQFQITRDRTRLHVGTNVAYARIHNEGFDDNVKVRAHKRRITMAFGKPIKPKTIQVSAHTARRYAPKREFLGFGTRQLHPMRRAVDNWAGDTVRNFK